MALTDETIYLRYRLTRLRLALRHIDEPLAVELLTQVVAEIEARIAAVESAAEPGRAKHQRPAVSN